MATKRRILAILVSLLYVSVAVVVGGLHHHEAGHTDCPACTWQTNATSDAPVVSITTALRVVVVAIVPACELVSSETPFLSSTASRAPPVTLA